MRYLSQFSCFLACGLVAAVGVAATVEARADADSPMGTFVLDKDGQPLMLAHTRGRPAPRKRRKTSYKVIDVKNGGTIEGVVIYKGRLPKPTKIQIVKDHDVCDHHAKEVPLVRRNDENQVAQAVVFLSNIRKGKKLPKTKTGPIIDQKGCEFHPHVQLMFKKQDFTILNSDPVLHNIQANLNFRTVFNHVTPKQGVKVQEYFADTGLAILNCNAHSWMKGYVYIPYNPYAQVTGEDGAFKLTDVPAGEYELAVWQEYFGEQIVDVKVQAGQTTTVEFESSRPPNDDAGKSKSPFHPARF